MIGINNNTMQMISSTLDDSSLRSSDTMLFSGIVYGCEVALYQPSRAGFIASPSIADRRIVLRSEATSPLFMFERCSFVVLPVDDWAGNTGGAVRYGSTVCLKHKFSNEFLSVLRHTSAVEDCECFRVTLLTKIEAGINCRFRILPRFKIRSEGEPVAPGDRVVLQLDNSRLYLHVSDMCIGIAVGNNGTTNMSTTSTLSLATTARKTWATANNAEVNAYESFTSFEIFRYDVGLAPQRPLPRMQSTVVPTTTSGVHIALPSTHAHSHDPPQPLGLARALVILHKESESVLTFNTAHKDRRGRGRATRLNSIMRRREEVFDDRGKPYLLPTDKTTSFDVAACSCNSLWVVEDVDPKKGGVMHTNTPVRIRHVATGKYLSVNDSRHVVMVDLIGAAATSDEAVDSYVHQTIFTFQPVLDPDIETITSNQIYLYLYNVAKSTWVAAERRESAILQSMMHLRVVERPATDQAVALIPAHSASQHDLNTVVGTMDYLTAYVQYFRDAQREDVLAAFQPLDDDIRRLVQRAIDALSGLIRFCTRVDTHDPFVCEGLPIRSHQQMLFDLQMHNLTFDILLAPFASAACTRAARLPLEGGCLLLDDLKLSRFKDVGIVCRLSIRLMKQMAKGSDGYSAPLQKFIPVLLTMGGYGLHVADTLLVVFSDSQQLPPAVAESACSHFIDLLLTSGRSAGYVRFLSRLCASGDAGVRRNQEVVLHKLVLAHPEMFVESQITDHVVHFHHGETWIPARQFFANCESKTVKFFESQVELLAKLCIGGHFECLAEVQRLVSREHALYMIMCDFASIAVGPNGQRRRELAERLSAIQATYLQIALHLYIKPELDHTDEVGSPRGSTGTTIQYKRPDENINGRRDSDFLKATKRSLLDHVLHTGGLVYDRQMDNQKLLRMLHVLHLIVHYRQLTESEVRTLMRGLLNLVSTARDQRTTDTTEHTHDDDADFDPYECTEDSVQIFAIKRAVCEILSTVIEQFIAETCEFLRQACQPPGSPEKLLKSYTHRVDDFHANVLNPATVVNSMLELVDYDSTDLATAAMRVAVPLCSLGRVIEQRIVSVGSGGRSDAEDWTATHAEALRISKVLRNNIAAGGAVMNENSVKEALGDLLSLYGADADDEPPSPIHRSREVERVLGHCGDVLNYTGVTRMLIDAAKSSVTDSDVFRLLMTIFKYYSMTPRHIPDIAHEMELFIRGLDRKETEPQCMLVTLQIMAQSEDMTEELDRGILRKFIERIARRPDPLVIRVLSHIVMKQNPVPHNQCVVLSLMRSSGLLDGIGESVEEARNQDVRFATVDLVVNCCVGNSDTRSVARQLIDLDRVLLLLGEDSASYPSYPHVLVFVRFLGCIHLALDETRTSNDYTQFKRGLTTNQRWWDVVRRFSRDLDAFAACSGRNDALLDFITNGVCPCLVEYFCVNYRKHHAERSPIYESVIEPALEAVTRSLLRALPYIDIVEEGVVDELLRALHAAHGVRAIDTTLKQRAADRRHCEKHNAGEDDRTQFYSPNTADILTSLTEWRNKHERSLMQPLIECLDDAPMHRKKKLLHHLRLHDFDRATAVGILTALTLRLDVEDERELAEVQTTLEKMGFMSVVTTLAESRHDEVITKALELGTAMLQGGNAKVQNSLLVYFGTHDEKFFLVVRKIISDSVVELRYRSSTQGRWASTRTRSNEGRLKFIIRIFRLLQLMCEGHNLAMQNYIRVQEDNLHSVNILQDVMQLVNEIVLAPPTPDMLPLVKQGFELLTELCQGPCEANQSALAHLDVCVCINRVLTHKEYELQDVDSAVEEEEGLELDEMLLEVKNSALTTLLSLLEGCNELTIPIIIIRQVVNQDTLVVLDSLLGVYQRHYTNKEGLLEAKAEADHLDTAFSICILLQSIVTFATALREREECVHVYAAKEVLEKYRCFSALMGRIEIQRGDRLENVYFRVPAICYTLTESSRHKVVWGVNRATQMGKLIDYFERCDELIYEMESAYALRKGFLGLTRKQITVLTNVSHWENAALVIAFLANGFFLFGPHQEGDNDLVLASNRGGVWSYIMLAISLFQVVVTVALIVLDYVLAYPLEQYHFFVRARRALVTAGRVSRDAREDEVRRLSPWSSRNVCGRLLNRPQTIFRLAMVCAAVASIWYPYGLALHLLGLVQKSQALLNVVVAVTQNGRQLLLTSGLGAIIAYYFSIIGFMFFQDEFDDAETVCRSLRSCFLHIMSVGIRSGGGIGELMSPAKNRFERVVYDFVFFALLIVIFLNIVFGMILDKFAELRELRNAKEEDMTMRCFICGIESHTFDRFSTSFWDHCHNEHNMWNYLFFMHHLRRKDQNDFTGQESYVHALIQRKDLSFFPVGRCMALEAHSTDESEQPATRRDVQSVASDVENVDASVGELATLTRQVLSRLPRRRRANSANEQHSHSSDADMSAGSPFPPRPSLQFSNRLGSGNHLLGQQIQHHHSQQQDHHRRAMDDQVQVSCRLEADLALERAARDALQKELVYSLARVQEKEREIADLSDIVAHVRTKLSDAERHNVSLCGELALVLRGEHSYHQHHSSPRTPPSPSLPSHGQQKLNAADTNGSVVGDDGSIEKPL